MGPAFAVHARARRRPGMAKDHIRTVRQRGQGLVTAPHLRLRRRACRHRACSGICRRSTRRSRSSACPCGGREEEYGEKLQIGGGKERMASLLTTSFVRGTASRRCRGPAGDAGRGTSARPRSTRRRWWRPDASRHAGRRRVSPRRTTRAGRSRSPRRRRNVRPGRARARGGRRPRASRFGTSWRATSCPRRSRRRTSLRTRRFAAWRAFRRGAGDRGFPQRDARGRRRRPVLRVRHRQQLHRGTRTCRRRHWSSRRSVIQKESGRRCSPSTASASRTDTSTSRI